MTAGAAARSDRRLTALVVDDERLARKELRRLLGAHPEVDVVGEAENADEARRGLAELSPDAVFLDVQMPGGSGFSVLEGIPPSCRVVFVTAYSEHALHAFDVNAADYLLKPVHPQRLAETIARLLGNSAPPAARPAGKLLPHDPLLLPHDGNYRVVRVSQIACLLADRDRTEVRTADGQAANVGRSLKEWEEALPPRHFLRIHRSTIVNVDHVERVEPWFHSSFRIHVKKIETPLVVSRRFAPLLRKRLA